MVDSPAQDVVPWKDNNSVDVEVVPSFGVTPTILSWWQTMDKHL